MPYTPIGNGFSNTIRDVEKIQVFLRFGRCTRMKFKIKKYLTLWENDTINEK